MAGSFTIEAPTTLAEAMELLARGDEDVRLIGGGTGLALLMRYGFFEPTMLVSVGRLPQDLAQIDVDAGGDLRLGALATLRQLERSPVVARHSPVLTDALHGLSSVRIRNVARLGGALAHGHPQMDLPPVLISLGASVEARSQRGSRWIDAEDLFLGYYETALEHDEILTAVSIPSGSPHRRATYRKVTARAADDWPLLGLAVAASVDDGVVTELRAAVSGVTDSASLLNGATDVLVGTTPGSREVADVAQDLAGQLDYHDGPNASASYQRHLVGVHLGRALEEVVVNGGDRTR